MSSCTYTNEDGELVVQCTYPLPDGVDIDALQDFVFARMAEALRIEIGRFADEFLLGGTGGGSKLQPN